MRKNRSGDRIEGTSRGDAERLARQLFGARVAQIRQEHGLTQKALAEELGLEQDQLSRYERGIHVPKLLTLLQLRKRLSVTLDHLIAGAAPGEIADPRIAKVARSLDALPARHRGPILTAVANMVWAAQNEVRRAAPGDAGE
ncbi:MAG TPA: helix-turn-helix transcriptional regulator [Thermoanaerobaculia bacterium]|nr:helix-turn-helix transcriptional regulator [Thermoanaerobaculia bacterium]